MSSWAIPNLGHTPVAGSAARIYEQCKKVDWSAKSIDESKEWKEKGTSFYQKKKYNDAFHCFMTVT